MKNYANFLIACGAIMLLLSLLLLRYNQPDSAAYLLCLADIAIGFVMLASGGIYLAVTKKKQK